MRSASGAQTSHRALLPRHKPSSHLLIPKARPTLSWLASCQAVTDRVIWEEPHLRKPHHQRLVIVDCTDWPVDESVGHCCCLFLWVFVCFALFSFFSLSLSFFFETGFLYVALTVLELTVNKAGLELSYPPTSVP